MGLLLRKVGNRSLHMFSQLVFGSLQPCRFVIKRLLGKNARDLADVVCGSTLESAGNARIGELQDFRTHLLQVGNCLMQTIGESLLHFRRPLKGIVEGAIYSAKPEYSVGSV